MTTESQSPSAFQRAEGGSRQVVLQLGLGVLAFVIGGIFSGGANVRLSERFGYIENEAVGFAVGWLLQRLWLFVVLPAFGWGIGRFTELKPLRFALTASLAGEVFAVLLYSGINGFDSIIASPPDVLARIVTLVLGMAIVVSAVGEGRKASREAQAAAAVQAEARKAEYAEYLAKQEAVGQKPPESSGPGRH